MRTTILDEEDWLDRRYYGGDLPAAAERSLHAAVPLGHDATVPEGHIQDALTEAPDHIAVLIAAYKFYFYRQRLAEALPYAEACLAHCLRQNNLPADWRALTPGRCRRRRNRAAHAAVLPCGAWLRGRTVG